MPWANSDDGAPTFSVIESNLSSVYDYCYVELS